MDYGFLLPPDNSSSGFDNIADLLFVSPTTMERYLDAARKISRLAVGDPSIPVMVNTYRLSPEQTQDIRVDSLPFGTRGGLGVRTDFPLDGDYVVKIDLSGAAREPHQIEVSVDGERMQLVTIGDNAGGGGRGRGGRGGHVAAMGTSPWKFASRSRRVRGSSESHSFSAMKLATRPRFVRACAAEASSPR